MITGENIKIESSFMIQHLADLQIDLTEGDHGRLVLRAYMPPGEEGTASVGDRIKVICCENNKGRQEILFCGIIQETHIYVENGVRQLILSAATVDIGMDKTENSQSFQDISMSWQEIMEKILSGYEGSMTCENPAVRVGKPVVQYKETDWQFLKRAASNMGYGIFSKEDSEIPVIRVGLPTTGKNVVFPTDSYECRVDETYYQGRRGEGVQKAKYLYYQVESEENYGIGDYAQYMGQTKYIFEKKVEWKNGALAFCYKLGDLEHFRKREMKNKTLVGAVICGKVVKTDKEKVYLKLDIDGDRGRADYPYPWGPVTGNILYSMPEPGTDACLYFPDDCEERAFCWNSICDTVGGDIPASSQEKQFVTKQGKKLLMYADKMALKGGRGTDTRILALDCDGCVMSAGQEKLVITAAQGVKLQAPQITICTPLEINQVKSKWYAEGKERTLGKKGSRNPATGGDASFSVRYEFSGLGTADGVLVGTEYEEYLPFTDDEPDIKYDSMGLKIAAGIALAVVVGVAVGVVVAVAAPVVFAVAVEVGIVAGIVAGCLTALAGINASVVTGLQDEGDTSLGEYLGNSLKASAEVGGAFLAMLAIPYGANMMTSMLAMPGLETTFIFGHWVSLETVHSFITLGCFGESFVNLFFKMDDVRRFEADGKPLWAPTGDASYDDFEELSDLMMLEMISFALTDPRLWQDLKNGWNQTKTWTKDMIENSKVYQKWVNWNNAKSLQNKTPQQIANMTRKQLKKNLPKGWDFQDHNGRIHIKDENGVIRIRIDPPDKTTNYTHIHIHDEHDNPLDINGNIVSFKDPAGHIPYNK